MGYGKIRQSLKRGMGGSNGGRGRSKKTEIMKQYSKSLRRQQARLEIDEQLNEIEEEDEDMQC